MQPVGARRLYKELANDVDNYNKLVDILSGMQQAEKIKSIHIDGKQDMYLIWVRKNLGKRNSLIWTSLTAEEIG